MENQPTNTPPAGVTFDATPVPASATPPPGVVFDSSPVPGAPAASTSAPGQPGQSTAPPAALTSNANDSLATKAAKTAGGVLQGVGEGVFSTAAGLSDIADKVTGTQPGTVNQTLHTLSTDAGHPNFAPQAIGQTAESLAEFLSGDELLKGLSMADRFAKFSKIAGALESSPLAMRAFSIGANALRQGAVQGLSTGIKSGSPSEGAAQGGVAVAATGAVESALHVPTMYRDFFSQKTVQDGLQNSIRNILAKTADAAGIHPDVTDTPSLRDAASALGAELKSKAGEMYSRLDDITGGRIQRYREQLEDVEREISNSIEGVEPTGPRPTSSFEQTFGVHPADMSDLTKRQSAIVAARDAAIEKIKAAGVDPGLLDKADATFKQGSALTDLSNSIRASLGGLRPELAKAANSTENVSTAKLFPRLNKLYDKVAADGTNRLEQAIGKENADALLQHVDAAHLAEQRVAARVKAFGSAVKTAVQAGGLGAGYEVVKHAFGGGQ